KRVELRCTGSSERWAGRRDCQCLVVGGMCRGGWLLLKGSRGGETGMAEAELVWLSRRPVHTVIGVIVNRSLRLVVRGILFGQCIDRWRVGASTVERRRDRGP